MRYIAPYVLKDLQKKMVFIGGPRQCGKTTLAKSFLKDEFKGIYLNWDSTSDKKKILNGAWGDQDELVVLDEIHKYKKWKTMVKGFFDTQGETHRFLVTGSARLNVFQRGGDSLLGRYHYWRLHPFSLFEIPKKLTPAEVFERLMRFGGFPEPFFDADEIEADRWRIERNRKILMEDIRELGEVRELHQMELLFEVIKSKVCSTLSVKSLADEVQASSQSIVRWLNIFERMYLIFIVRGYDRLPGRAVHKPIKIYFFDNGDVEGNEGQRFENLVATHLLLRNHFLEDRFGQAMDLFYLKDKNQREIDFLITQHKKPIEIIEVKWSSKDVAPHLSTFASHLRVRTVTQIVARLKSPWKKGALQVVSPLDYFSFLPRAKDNW